jgi:hypothetical protein
MTYLILAIFAGASVRAYLQLAQDLARQDRTVRASVAYKLSGGAR